LKDWPPLLRRIAGNKFVQWHQARLTRLAQEHAYQTIYFSYPPPTRLAEVMPTRLGNILKSSEIYASQRYNLDPVLIWPRLYSLLPETASSALATLRSLIEFHLAVSVVAALFGVVSGVYLLLTGANPLEFLMCFWGSMFVAWIAYRSSLSSVTAYAEQVKAAIDLYRNALLIKLRIPLPESPEQELATWQEVGVFLMRNLRGHPEQWHYTDTVAGPPDV
jgi:hypothetical protein